MDILKYKELYMFPCSHHNHFYKQPLELVKGKGQYVYDNNNNKYLDLYGGVSVMNCGHSNPVINQIITNQQMAIQHTTILYLSSPVVKLAQKLVEITPESIQNVFFTTSGSEANDGAFILAMMATGRDEFIALENGLHGRTYLTMSATHIPMWRSSFGLSDRFRFIKGLGDITIPLEERCHQSLANLTQLLKERGDKIAALILEPIQGNGGIIPMPSWYITKIKALLEAYGVLLIFDEIQTGFGRTGKMFCSEYFDVEPDIMTVAKALGNGYPIAAFMATKEVGQYYNKPSASTLGGNQVGCQVGIGVINYLQKNDLIEKSKNLGAYLLEALNKIDHPYIKDVRGRGLMIGIEIDTTEHCDIIHEALKGRGILVGKNGMNRQVIAIQPPLVLTKADLDSFIEAFNDILGAL